MGYKTNITKEFKEKGFYDPNENTIISTTKENNGVPFSIKEVFDKVAKDGVEVEFVVRQKDQIDDIEE